MIITSSVQLGSVSLDNGISVRVHRTVGAVAGLCEVIVPAPVQVSAVPGDDVRVAIGVGEALTVFTGQLDAVEARGNYAVFRALDARVLAARIRVNQIFQEQTSNAILDDLASSAGLDVGSLSAGITLVWYLADEARSVLAHICHLADIGGAHLFIDRYGTLQTCAYDDSGATLQFNYGEHVLSVGAAARQSGGAVEVRTEGAAASNGADAAFWPTTDTAGTAGIADADGPASKLWRPEIRSMEEATALATSTARRRAQYGLRVTLTCLGLPDIELGNGVTIASVPGADSELSARVIGVEHRLNPWDGFVTSLTMEGVDR